MKVIHPSEVAEQEVVRPLFTGPVGQQTVVTEAESQFNVAFIHFPEGVRNKFHTHTTDQLLIVTRGTGMVATDSEQVELSVNDIVLIPAGEKHWHGAVDGSDMIHISILGAGSQVEQLED